MLRDMDCLPLDPMDEIQDPPVVKTGGSFD